MDYYNGGEKPTERSRWTPLTRMLLSGEMTQERQKELTPREKFDRWMVNEGYRRVYVISLAFHDSRKPIVLTLFHPDLLWYSCCSMLLFSPLVLSIMAWKKTWLLLERHSEQLLWLLDHQLWSSTLMWQSFSCLSREHSFRYADKRRWTVSSSSTRISHSIFSLPGLLSSSLGFIRLHIGTTWPNSRLGTT